MLLIILGTYFLSSENTFLFIYFGCNYSWTISNIKFKKLVIWMFVIWAPTVILKSVLHLHYKLFASIFRDNLKLYLNFTKTFRGGAVQMGFYLKFRNHFYLKSPKYQLCRKWRNLNQNQPKQKNQLCPVGVQRYFYSLTKNYSWSNYLTPTIRIHLNTRFSVSCIVVSIGVFWFYFVSFSHNGVCFLRFIFNCTLAQYQNAQ